MSLNADLREFIELLNSRGIEYVIVGAHSLAFHARPRYTGDLDILVRPSPENAAKLVSLLRDFGFAKGDLAESDFTVPEQMIQLGRAPNRIDLLTSISGVTVEDAFSTRMSTELEGLPVFVLSKEALIRNKRAVGRPQDIADLEMLEESYNLPLRTAAAGRPRHRSHNTRGEGERATLESIRPLADR